jgi:hypothetical protein
MSATISPNKILHTDVSAAITVNAISDYTMIRTGVQGRGSCYLHALFTGMSGRDFRGLSIRKRDEIIHQYRQALATNLTKEEYLGILGGNLAKLETFQIISQEWSYIESKLFREIRLSYPKKEKDENPILRQVHENIDNLSDIDGQVQKLDPILRNPFRTLLNDKLEEAYENFKSSLYNYTYYINQYHVNYIDKKLNVNVIFVKTDGSLYMSNSDCEEMLRTGENFVLVYYLDESHFETISRVNDDYTVTSFFQRNDPMIQQLLLICH